MSTPVSSTADPLTNVARLADGTRGPGARCDTLGRRVEATRADGSTERHAYFPVHPLYDELKTKGNLK
jgi:hypothetical protein